MKDENGNTRLDVNYDYMSEIAKQLEILNGESAPFEKSEMAKKKHLYFH